MFTKTGLSFKSRIFWRNWKNEKWILCIKLEISISTQSPDFMIYDRPRLTLLWKDDPWIIYTIIYIIFTWVNISTLRWRLDILNMKHNDLKLLEFELLYENILKQHVSTEWTHILFSFIICINTLITKI